MSHLFGVGFVEGWKLTLYHTNKILVPRTNPNNFRHIRTFDDCTTVIVHTYSFNPTLHIVDVVLYSMCAIDDSWNHSDAADIDDRVKNQLKQKKLLYESHTILAYTIPGTQQTSQYIQINTRSINIRSRTSKYYCCAATCRVKRSVFDRLIHLQNHICSFHNKPTVHPCTTCFKQFSTLPSLKKHVKYCDAQWNDRIKSVANNKNILQDEIDDAAQNLNIDDVVDDSVTVSTNIPASNTARHIGYIDRLIRVEQLQLLFPKPSLDDNNASCLTEYVPTQCDVKHIGCHVLRHGTTVRICYDVCEPILLEVPQYRCITHSSTLSGLSTTIQQHLLDNKIVKSVDIVQYDRTLITASLWHHIASHALIALNDAHIPQLIRHTYQRHDIHKQLKHNVIVHGSTESHCSHTECYKLSYGTNNDQLIQLHAAAVQRGLGIRQTRQIFQQSIIPEHLWPCATEFQRDVLLKHMSHAISFDHTFKIARFGVYNDIVNQHTYNPNGNNPNGDNRDGDTAIGDQPADSVVRSTSQNDDNLNDSINDGIHNLNDNQDDSLDNNPNANSPNWNNPNGDSSETRKRKYKMSVQFNRLNAQLLTIMDSTGLAIYCTIVPSGQTQYVVGLLVHILEHQLNNDVPADRIVNVVSVDNASHIGNQLMAAYRGKRDGTNVVLTVLQDLWHARTRITRELRREHPQYRDAMYDIKQIIARLIKCEYNSRDELRTAMTDYKLKYTTAHKYSAIGNMHTISTVGAAYGIYQAIAC